MPGSIARETLEAARLFAKQADAAGNDIMGFRHNLEAAIVFGRSVTFHIQKEFTRHAGFDKWYSEQQLRWAITQLAGISWRSEISC